MAMKKIKPINKSDVIRATNDFLRNKFKNSSYFKILLDSEVSRSSNHSKILSAVQSFKKFDNYDKNGLHEMGIFKVANVEYKFKFLYFNSAMNDWRDPLEEDCVRGLFIYKTRDDI